MRPTFDRRLWILLFWSFILKCVPQTEQQQITSQNVVSGQKILELANTSDESTNIRSLSECANCSNESSSSSSRSSSNSGSDGSDISISYNSRNLDSNVNLDIEEDEEDEEQQQYYLQQKHHRQRWKHHQQQQQHHQFTDNIREHFVQNKQRSHQHRRHHQQLKKLHDEQQINVMESPGNHNKNVQHENDDLLKETLGGYNPESNRQYEVQHPSPQLPSPSRGSNSADSALTTTESLDQRFSDIRSLSLPNNSLQQGQQQQENSGTEFIDVSSTPIKSSGHEDEDSAADDDDNDEDDDDFDSTVSSSSRNNNLHTNAFHKFPLKSNSKNRKFSSDTSSNGYSQTNALQPEMEEEDDDIVENQKFNRENEENLRIKRNINRGTLKNGKNYNNDPSIGVASKSLSADASSSSSSSLLSSSLSSINNSRNENQRRRQQLQQQEQQQQQQQNQKQSTNAISSSDISKSGDISYNDTLSSNLNNNNPPSSTSTSNGDPKSSELFIPQLPSPLPKTDVSNFTYTSSKVDKMNIIRDSTKSSLSTRINSNEPIIIIDDGEEFDSGISSIIGAGGGNSGIGVADSRSIEEYARDEPRILPLRPIIRGPYDEDHDDEMSIVYAEQHTEIKLACEVDIDVATNAWFKNGQIVHTMDRNSRVADYRFIKESLGGLTITNVMLEDDGKWQCEAENARGYVENARPIKLVVLDRPKSPYLLIDSRRLDAGNIFVPVKENSELSLACVSEGGNPKPTLTWEVLLSPGVDRHAQKVAAEVLELEEIKSEKDKEPYKINSGAKSEARLPAVYRAHHNARILCVMEHPTLKMRQNASLLLDVQYTPSFAISRTPGFGYPLREGIEVSLKCDVDSNPPSTPRWQKDDGDTPVSQTGDGYLNFTSIRREHSGWYKCTSRHLNFQYSSIGYYLSVRYDSVDVTSEPDDQEVSVAASHNPNKGQLEVQLGGAVTLQCPQGSLGCWSHLDPVTARLRGLGVGISTSTGQFSLKDVVYQDAGTYKCIGQSPSNKKKLEVLQTVGVLVKGAPTAVARNATPVAYPGSPLHLTVEFCANPAAYAARWLHGDRVYTPGNQYGSTVLAYGVNDLPTPFCKEARLTYVSMHERVPRTFYFIVSSPGGVAEAIFKVNFTLRYRTMSNSIDEEEEELTEPEEIHFPVFGSGSSFRYQQQKKQLLIFHRFTIHLLLLLLCIIYTFMNVLL